MKNIIATVLFWLLTPSVLAQLASPDDNGVTFGHVHLNVSDIEEHKRIWVEHFNGTIVERGPLIVAKLPNMMVALTEQEPTMGSRDTVMHHFGFKVGNMAHALKG